MAKVDIDRTIPGTLELIRDADGNYRTNSVGLKKITSLSLPDFSTSATTVTVADEPKTATDITQDTVQDQTQLAFKMPERDDNEKPLNFEMDLFEQATDVSSNLQNVDNRFDAVKFDETEDKTAIKTPEVEDPFSRVFSPDTAQEQFRRQTTLPSPSIKQTEDMSKVPSRNDLSKGQLRQLNRTGNVTVNGVVYNRGDINQATVDRGTALPEEGEFVTTTRDLPMARDNLGIKTDSGAEQLGTMKTTAEDTLGIKADPSAVELGEMATTPVDTTGFEGVSQMGALASQGEKEDVFEKPKEKSLKTFTESLNAAFQKSPMMSIMRTLGRADTFENTHSRSYFSNTVNGNRYKTRGELGSNVDPNRFAGNPSENLFSGMNKQSAFGNLEKAGQKRIDTREKTIARKGYKPGDKFYDDTQNMKNELNDFKQDKTTFSKDQPVTGTTKPGEGGGTESKSKIVCTMMNESYGFGSFRNKIWMKFHGNIAPEYQKGYHKLFLPLVNYAKQKGITNKIIKNILEHIAVHSTIDMRQTLRGKRHTLGRLYRKVILPLCYWAGKK